VGGSYISPMAVHENVDLRNYNNINYEYYLITVVNLKI
jgi:hypothetical protein